MTGLELLSEITIFQKYAKHIDSENRRETWQEICARYRQMLINKYPELETPIKEAVNLVEKKKILPSMRGLQFAGKAIEVNNSRIYNCSFLHIDSIESFSETMYLLLGGTGVGYSVQFQHIEKLPIICPSNHTLYHIIEDSIEGWADAVKTLIGAYFGKNGMPKFDYSQIRPKGSKLMTAGGRAPGHEPLQLCLEKIDQILARIPVGSKLRPIDAHDILCHIADSVLSGGIRRSAMIALFSENDNNMLVCKTGEWYKTDLQRARANNSVVMHRDNTSKESFDFFFDVVKNSGSGEPGIYWTNDLNWGTNPCCEIALRPFQFCNLTTINGSDILDIEDFQYRCQMATFLGTLQAGFTDFKYLRPEWKKVTEEEALIGVSITGVASNTIHPDWLEESAYYIKKWNQHYAAMIGINPAARTTTNKPDGTTSCVLMTSSGIHDWHDSYYLRRIRILKTDPLYTYFSIHLPDLVEDDSFVADGAILKFPVESPHNAYTRTNSSMLNLLSRVFTYNTKWVRSGHYHGVNTNNVSATISVKNDEWNLLHDWMWEQRNNYNGLSILPFDDHTYIQAPFETITKEQYKELSSKFTGFILKLEDIVEMDDNTTRGQEIACAGGKCEI
jgi:ribonucleoside-diphosphate reductase alpha chain